MLKRCSKRNWWLSESPIRGIRDWMRRFWPGFRPDRPPLLCKQAFRNFSFAQNTQSHENTTCNYRRRSTLRDARDRAGTALLVGRTSQPVFDRRGAGSGELLATDDAIAARTMPRWVRLHADPASHSRARPKRSVNRRIRRDSPARACVKLPYLVRGVCELQPNNISEDDRWSTCIHSCAIR